MKPVYLEFCGINSFSEKATIDFRALLSGGVFGVFGDTGSGKSTLLDCIHLALYGKMERGSGSEYLNHNVDSAYVLFDFEITADGKTTTYRVHRERRRKNNVAKANLYEGTTEGKWLALAEGTRDVDEKLEEILGLTFADFKMCIALPQGDFAALVQAAPSERLKLISRLFDLEKYGERLSKAVGEKYYKAEEECNLVLARIGENAGCDEETLAAKKLEIDEDNKALADAQKQLSKAEETLLALEKLEEEKRDFDELEKALKDYVERLPQMEKRRKAIEKIPFARAVEKDKKALETNERAIFDAKNGAQTAEREAKDAEEKLRLLKEKQEAESYDEKILQATVDRDKVKAAGEDIKAEQDAKALYDNSKKQYNDLKAKCIVEDFDGKIKSLQAELEELGEDENLLDYLKHNFSEVFAQDAYGKFREDLRILSVKYPAASQDIEALLDKYTPKKTDEKNLDIGQMNLEFKALGQKKKALRDRIEAIKKDKLDFESIQKKMDDVKELGTNYHVLWDTAKAKVAAIKALGELSDLERRLSVLKEAKDTAQKNVERATERLQRFRAEQDKQKSFAETYEKARKTLQENLENSLKESGFSSVDEAIALLDGMGDAERERLLCEDFFDKYNLAKSKRAEVDEKKFVGVDENALFVARTRKREAKLICDGLAQKIADNNAEYKILEEKRKRVLEFEKELKEKEKRKKLCDELHKLLGRNKFLEFIAAEYLQEICARASKILLSLTAGRYFLRYDKEFKVGDYLGGGKFRAADTLSGGETFLVSLSLALALSGEICARSRRSMEFFFLDEGFGTLDEKLVDTVMDVLTKLSKEFAVGLISHVEELKHRIENKILVTGATESHGSQVRIVKL